MTNRFSAMLAMVCLSASFTAGAQTRQSEISLASVAHESLQAFERFRLEQLRTTLLEARFQQALKQESIADQPYRTKEDAENAMRNRPESEPEDVWKRYIDTSVEQWSELNRLNALVVELTEQIKGLEKALMIGSDEGR